MPEQIGSAMWLGLGITVFPSVFSALVTYLPVTAKDIDKLFDSFSSVKCAAPGETLCHPGSDNSPQIGHWTKASIGGFCSQSLYRATVAYFL